jgi:hypothetical protein
MGRIVSAVCFVHAAVNVHDLFAYLLLLDLQPGIGCESLKVAGEVVL